MTVMMAVTCQMTLMELRISLDAGVRCSFDWNSCLSRKRYEIGTDPVNINILSRGFLSISWASCYVVSAVYSTATWLVGWMAGWLDVTCRYCIKKAKPILKLFRPSGSILVSSDPCADMQFQGEPLQWGLYIHGDGKNWRLSTGIAVYLGNGAK